jgi:hypothetical protein
MAKIEGENTGFFRIRDAIFTIDGVEFKPAAVYNPPKPSADEIISIDPATLTFGMTITDADEFISLFERQFARLLARKYIRPRATHRLILRQSGRTLFDGQVIIKIRKGRVAKIAGRSLNHAKD